MVKVMKTKFRNLFLLVGGFILLILFLQCFKIIENFAENTTTETTTPAVETVAAKEAKAAKAKALAAAIAKAAAAKEAAKAAAKAAAAAKSKAPTNLKTQKVTITCMKGNMKSTRTGKPPQSCGPGYSKV